VGCRPPSHPSLKLPSRARACPQLSANQEGPLSTGGSILAVGKDEVFGGMVQSSRKPPKAAPCAPVARDQSHQGSKEKTGPGVLGMRPGRATFQDGELTSSLRLR